MGKKISSLCVKKYPNLLNSLPFNRVDTNCMPTVEEISKGKQQIPKIDDNY